MNEIHRKIKHLQVQIRRAERQKIISKFRNDIINSQGINNFFQTFLQQKNDQIPSICLQGISAIYEQLFQKFIQQLQAQGCFIKQEINQKNTWFFDCSSKNNLKFMTELSKVCHDKLKNERLSFSGYSNENSSIWHKVYNNMFKSTIKVNSKYSALSFNYQLQVRDSKCYIQAFHPVYQDFNQPNSLLSLLHQDYNEDRWLAFLEFWGNYMEIWQICDIQGYVVSIKAFLLWFEHTEIHQHEQAYFFIYQILRFIKESKLLPKPQLKKNQQNLQELTKILEIFLNRMKRCIPFAFAKKNFIYLGKIAMQFLQLSETIQGLMSELLYRSETLVIYLTQIFKLDLQKQNVQRIKIGIKLVYYYISWNDVLQFNNPLQKIQIFRKFIKDYLFHPQLQFMIAMNFSQLAKSDLNNQMKQLYEEIDFQRLLQSMNPGGQQFIYQLAIDTLELFRQNLLVHNKILKRGQLIKKLRLFCQTFERQELFIGLIKAVDSNIQYFVDNYTNQLNQIIDYAGQLQFQGKNAFLNQATQYIELKNKEASL